MLLYYTGPRDMLIQCIAVQVYRYFHINIYAMHISLLGLFSEIIKLPEQSCIKHLKNILLKRIFDLFELPKSILKPHVSVFLL